jgi:hypothetical protein
MKKRAGVRKSAGWSRHFFHRKESLRATWKLRLAVVGLIVPILLTRGIWTEWIAQGLVCDADIAPSDALLIENFDPDYLLFEHAETLRRSGVAPRVFAFVEKGRGPGGLNGISQGFTAILADAAHLPSAEFIPISATSEPITLNVAHQIRDYLTARHVKSIVLVTRNFRSRRSLLIYDSVLSKAGIRVGCAPVVGMETAENWTETNHGMADVVLQFIKLQYYRLWVLR